eukprot:3118457-Amphidinium_carterae.1
MRRTASGEMAAGFCRHATSRGDHRLGVASALVRESRRCWHATPLQHDTLLSLGQTWSPGLLWSLLDLT